MIITFILFYFSFLSYHVFVFHNFLFLTSNYAPTIAPQVEAAKKGYTQILWLFGKDHYITEVGTMNMFIFMHNEKGEKELITPPLDDGTILPGVTRDSILQLTRSWKEFKVSERPINMKELLQALKQNRVRFFFFLLCCRETQCRLMFRSSKHLVQELQQLLHQSSASDIVMRYVL